MYYTIYINSELNNTNCAPPTACWRNLMSKAVLTTVFCLTVICLCAAAVVADVPQLINYQGKLMDSAGDPVADDTYSIYFRIYDAATDGTEVWASSGAQSVTTSSGLFTWELGSSNPIPTTLADYDALWLGITVGTDSEMSPRTKLVSVAYSFKSLVAENALEADSATHADEATNAIYADTATIALNAGGGSGVPIGSIVAWHKSHAGTPALPDGWVECNGQSITDGDSPYNGYSVPELNYSYRFLRGATASGSVGGQETHTHSSVMVASSPSGVPVSGPNVAYHMPPFFQVVWIIKIK